MGRTEVPHRQLKDKAGMFDGQNVIIGADTPRFTAFERNVILGFRAMQFAQILATHNVVAGSYSLRDLEEGVLNSAFGTDVLTFLIEGGWNSGFGAKALRYLVYGDHNTAGGHNALCNLLEGNRHTALGQGAGLSQLYGDECIFIGKGSGKFSRDGSRVIAIGVDCGFDEFIIGSASDVILIGNNLNADPARSNYFNIGNAIKGSLVEPRTLGFAGKEDIPIPIVKDFPSFVHALDALGLIKNEMDFSAMTTDNLFDIGGEGAAIESSVIYGGEGAAIVSKAVYGGGGAEI